MVEKTHLNISFDIMMVILDIFYIELPQIIKYAKHFDTNKTISLKVIHERNVKKICLKLRKKLAA